MRHSLVADRAGAHGRFAEAAARLGYVFLQYRPRLDCLPAGPRLMYLCGRLVRPLLFTRPG
jgi:hypothetical protein